MLDMLRSSEGFSSSLGDIRWDAQMRLKTSWYH
jgi:hypothetical protein